ncbi:MAG: transposase [Chitinophagales bacterium]
MEYRNSYIEFGGIYFWTATINNWYQLLDNNELKEIILQSLKYLVDNELVKVYAFVIMPNHIHFVWQLLKMNGKEKPSGSFLKYTAHKFRKYLLEKKPNELEKFKVKASNKEHEFWQRDPFSFELTKRATAWQKIDYIHNNP